MEADATLLAAARRMDEYALIRIFDLYAPALHKYAFRLCRDARMADQIVGDVFAKLLEHLSAGKGPSANLRSYLFEMVYHLFVDEGRYSARRAPLEAIELWQKDGSSTDESAEEKVLLRIVLRAIMTDLTEAQRQVIILRFMEEFSLKETALIIGKKVGNVKVIQNRAIATLRKALEYQVVETSDISIMIRRISYA